MGGSGGIKQMSEKKTKALRKLFLKTYREDDRVAWQLFKKHHKRAGVVK